MSTEDRKIEIEDKKVDMKDRKLFILRGLPGSGKSEKAKQLVGNGVIHSTDNFFIRDGKYVFDSDNIGRFHCLNLMNSIRSMQRGVSPIIIDNTNIVSSHCSGYVDQGKLYGYEIIIVEPDTPWAFNVEELVKRNTHDTPRETIVEMLEQYEKPDLFKKKLRL